MKILLIGGSSKDKQNTEDMKRYVEYFAGNGNEVFYAHFDQFSFLLDTTRFEVFDHRNNQSLADYDLIIFRGKVRMYSQFAYCISRYCKTKGIKYFNDYSPYRPASKLAQAVTMFELGLPAPLTIFATDPGVFGSLIDQNIQYPCIIKSTMGSHGNDNYLSRDTTQTQTILADNKDIPFIAQSFFPNNCDYRVLCFGSQELVIKRTAQGDTHLNNTSQGGAAELVDAGYLPEIIIQQSHKFADHLGMTMSGVDVLYNDQTGDYVFLEINSQPQLTDGAFPEEKRELLHAYLLSESRAA